MSSTRTDPIPHQRQRNPFRLGVFTRLVDEVPPPRRYTRALELLMTADRLGFDTGWVAQHHAGNEGGLPSPLVFLAAAAQYTRRLTLATGIITLALENPVRLAEDAAVLAALSNGRLELGFGTGGGEPAFAIFGVPFEDRQQEYDRAFAVVRDALAGQELTPAGSTLFPPARPLLATVWEATFGVAGAVRAAEHGSGLLLARTAIRPGQNGASQPVAIRKALRRDRVVNADTQDLRPVLNGEPLEIGSIKNVSIPLETVERLRKSIASDSRQAMREALSQLGLESIV